MTNKEATDTEIPNSDSNSTQDNINFGISNTRDKRLRVTKRQKRINWRRNAVMQAMIQGVTSSYDVAKALSISQTTAFKDIQWLKNNATNELQYHIQERIPWSHKVCTEGISEVLRYAWSLVLEQDNRTNKIATLALILQCYKELMDISTNASVITEAMNEVERMKQEVLGYTNIVKADRHEIISTDQKEGGD